MPSRKSPTASSIVRTHWLKEHYSDAPRRKTIVDLYYNSDCADHSRGQCRKCLCPGPGRSTTRRRLSAVHAPDCIAGCGLSRQRTVRRELRIVPCDGPARGAERTELDALGNHAQRSTR